MEREVYSISEVICLLLIVVDLLGLHLEISAMPSYSIGVIVFVIGVREPRYIILFHTIYMKLRGNMILGVRGWRSEKKVKIL